MTIQKHCRAVGDPGLWSATRSPKNPRRLIRTDLPYISPAYRPYRAFVLATVLRPGIGIPGYIRSSLRSYIRSSLRGYVRSSLRDLRAAAVVRAFNAKSTGVHLMNERSDRRLLPPAGYLRRLTRRRRGRDRARGLREAPRSTTMASCVTSVRRASFSRSDHCFSRC